MGGTCRGRGDQGGGRWEEGSSGQRMERVSCERASHLLGCAGTTPGRMGSAQHHGAGSWQSFLCGLCCLALSDQGWRWGQEVWALQEPYGKPEVCPSHLCCRKLSGRQEPAGGLQVAGPKQTHQPHGLGNDEHISTAAALKVLEFLVACEVVLQPLDAFKHFRPSFQGALNLLVISNFYS